ncbi:DUF6279 family lipoprotein [Vibrio olivae]|uniref:DUF6279 family lipoprotein n=1 Tax=Vibrio olivae TaxID=1243002 RepID=A0ABV5HNK2_9VIBR
MMKKCLGLILVCSVLVGCSTQFIYRNIDWFLIDYIEDFVELTDQQEEMVSRSVAHLSTWHKSSEIPRYIAHIDELMAVDPTTFTAQQFQYQRRKMTQHTQRLLRKAEPDIEALTAAMSDEQVSDLMSAIRTQHAEFKNKYQDLTEQELRDVYRERAQENLEDWLGDLTRSQQVLLSEWQDALIVTTPDWIDQQTNMRIELKTLLAKRSDHDFFSRQFETLLLHPESFFSDTLKQKNAFNQTVTEKYMVAMIRSMTPDQTAHVRSELEDWKQIAQEVLATEGD